MKKMVIGWREWVGLPDWGIDAIKAKIDTGARTSSLHALDPEIITIKGAPYVKFLLMPVQRSLALGQEIIAPMIDRRKVTNSGGFGQERFVVMVKLKLGDIEREIEVTLANRRDMKFRMLLGRQALTDVMVNPVESYLLGKTPEQRQFLRSIREDLKRHSS